MKLILGLLVLLLNITVLAEESFKILCSKGDRPDNIIGFRQSQNGDIDLSYGESWITFKARQYSQINGENFKGEIDSNLFVAVNQEVKGISEGSDFSANASFSFTYNPIKKSGFLTLIESEKDDQGSSVIRTVNRNVYFKKCE